MNHRLSPSSSVFLAQLPPIPRPPVVVGDGEDADQIGFKAIVKGVRIAPQRDRSRVVRTRSAELRQADKEFDGARDYRFERRGLERSRFSEDTIGWIR